MRVDSVAALAFGPFSDQSLEFAPGLTLVHGPNESGKSTWHAVLYAAICGMRRGRGRIREDDGYFRDRHHPWNGSEWEVSAIVVLQDGRRVDLHHDLNGRVDCQATDADMGRDYTDEIINDGAPDGSLWLGLDRRSFLSTACVRQADIQSVIDQANALQVHLQRAAATAGSDSTAAAVLTAMDKFRRENIGLDRANSTRPLRAARVNLDQARVRLEDAERMHQDYVTQLDQLEQLEEQWADARRNLQLAEAANARLAWQRMQRQADRARELADKHPEAPPNSAELRQQSQVVSTALDRWDNRPNTIEVLSPTSDELLRQIQELPPVPEGDTRPHTNVVQAKNQIDAAVANLERHRGRMPIVPEEVHTGEMDAQQLRRLADDLALEDPNIDPELEARVERGRSRLESLEAPTGQSQTTARSFLLRPILFLFRVLGFIVRALIGTRAPRVDYAAIARASEELREAEAALGDIRFRLNEVRIRKQQASTTLNEKGLPVDSAALNELATRLEDAAQRQRELERWRVEEQGLQQADQDATEALKQALEARGVLPNRPLVAAFTDYERECERRAEQAQRASQRPHFEQLLQSRRQHEAAAADSDSRRAEASGLIVEAAQMAGIAAEGDDALVASLRAWLDDADDRVRELEEAQDEWEELEGLLDGRSIAQLQGLAHRRKQESDELAQGLNADSVAQVDLDEESERTLAGLRSAATTAETALAERRGSLEQFARSMLIVAEAEEEVARAEENLSRIRELDRILVKTQEFLGVAQDRVHRNVAPLLRDSLNPWLQTVTSGRYNDVRVDPDNLNVYVSGDGYSWREASLLSHGTAEQIYLLLRVGMSRILTKEGETCPLILDDVTVHCDPERQVAILSLLHSISQDQQVILFSQEPETLAWAKEHLSDEKDRLIELDPSGIPA